MKNDTTTTFLNFVLAALVILGVLFAILAMQRTREYRAITPLAMQANAKAMMVQSLVNDVSSYNAQVRSPEIARILQSLQPKTAAK
jgi:ABC-type transport system involved in cytochrome c biogenesis permease subunit